MKEETNPRDGCEKANAPAIHLAPRADHMAEMWRELAEYQPQADKDGHGESWAAMCEKRTEGSAASAAWAAAAASAAGNPPAWAAAAAATDAAGCAAWAAEKAGRDASRYTAAWAAEAIAAIRRAKEGTR